MAERRSEITIAVGGINELRSLNRALTDHKKLLQEVATMYEAFGGSSRFAITALTGLSRELGKVTGGLKEQQKTLRDLASAQKAVTAANNEITAAQDRTGQSARRMGGEFGNLLKQAIQYRTISLIFHEVTDAVRATMEQMMEMEKQTSRVRRVTEGNVPTGIVRAGMYEEMARTGQGAKELGEAFYQLGTFVKDTDTLLSAVRVTMDLVVGTESDVRDTARAVMQVYNQFGDQLDKTASKAENFRRIGEAIAITYRTTNTEVSEIIQALKYLGPLADAARVPVSQLFGVLGGLEAGGVRGRQAGTSASQFIAQLLKRSTEGDELKAGKYIYSGIIQRTEDGGLDLIKTLQAVRDHLNNLNLKKHTHEADEFVIAMGGTQNAIRFVGTLTQTLDRMDAVTNKVAQGFRGATHEAEQLRNIMQDNLPKQMEKAWAGALAGMSQAWSEFAKGIGLQGLLRELGEAGHISASTNLQNEMLKAHVSGNDTYRASVLRTLMHGMVEGGDSPLPALRSFEKVSGLPQSVVERALTGVPKRNGQYYYEDIQKAAAQLEGSSRNSIEQSKRDEQGFRSQKAAGVMFNPLSGKYEALDPYGRDKAKPGKPFGKRETDEAIAARRKKAEAAAAKAAADLNRQAADMDAHAGYLSDMMERYNRDTGGRIPDAKIDEAMSLWDDADDLHDRADALLGRPPRSKWERRSAMHRDKLEAINERWAQEQREQGIGRAETDYSQGMEKYGFLQPEAMALAARQDALQRADYENEPRNELGLYNLPRTGAVAQLKRRIEEWGHGISDEERDDATGEWRRRPHPGAADWTVILQKWLLHDQPGYLTQERRERAADRAIGVDSAISAQGPLGAMQGDLADARSMMAQFASPKNREQSAALRQAEQDVGRLTKAIHDYHEEIRDENVSLAEHLIGLRNDERIRQFGLTEMPVRGGLGVAYKVQRMDAEARMYEDMAANSGDWYQQKEFQGRADAIRHQMRYESAERRLGREDSERGIIQGSLTQGVIGMFHGTTGVGGIARGLGDQFVEQGITKFMERLFDPQVSAANRQIEALDRNTAALGAVGSGQYAVGGNGGGGGVDTGTMLGSAAAVGAAGFLGNPWATSSVKPGGAAKSGNVSAARSSVDTRARLERTSIDKWQTGDVLQSGTAAYSVFSAGMEHGITLGGVMGGYMAGSAIGGPVGGLIGAGLDLFGGLFHHAPAAQPKDLNPAIYHAPSDFDYYAYRYRATGIVPQGAGDHTFFGNHPTITVNVITDGVKRSVKAEIAGSTVTGRASTVNAYYDSHAPF